MRSNDLTKGEIKILTDIAVHNLRFPSGLKTETWTDTHWRLKEKGLIELLSLKDIDDNYYNSAGLTKSGRDFIDALDKEYEKLCVDDFTNEELGILNAADFARPELAAMLDIGARTRTLWTTELANSHWSLKQKGFIDWVELIDPNRSPFFFVTLTDRGIRFKESTAAGQEEESDPSELVQSIAEQIAEKGRHHKDRWFEQWGHLYEEFQFSPTTGAAVDLLTFTNPPAFVVDELREFLIKPPKKPRGRPKKRQQHYDRVAFLFAIIKRDNPKMTALDIDNEIVRNFFSQEDQDGDVDAETVRKWRGKARAPRFM